MKIKIFADCADLAVMAELRQNPLIQGFTTNPTLMRQAGVLGYRTFAKDAIDIAGELPLSLEVLSDDLEAMEYEARQLADMGKNIYVKIPVVDTKGESTLELVYKLSRTIHINVTAVMTRSQVWNAHDGLVGGMDGFISIFAGRIADTGTDPTSVIPHSRYVKSLLWASTREVYNVFQAEQCGCAAITMSPELTRKLELIGKDLDKYSMETVMQFHEDAKKAGYKI